MNWHRVCTSSPTHVGGLGLLELERSAYALHVRWLWLKWQVRCLIICGWALQRRLRCGHFSEDWPMGGRRPSGSQAASCQLCRSCTSTLEGNNGNGNPHLGPHVASRVTRAAALLRPQQSSLLVPFPSPPQVGVAGAKPRATQDGGRASLSCALARGARQWCRHRPRERLRGTGAMVRGVATSQCLLVVRRPPPRAWPHPDLVGNGCGSPVWAGRRPDPRVAASMGSIMRERSKAIEFVTMYKALHQVCALYFMDFYL